MAGEAIAAVDRLIFQIASRLPGQGASSSLFDAFAAKDWLSAKDKSFNGTCIQRLCFNSNVRYLESAIGCIFSNT